MLYFVITFKRCGRAETLSNNCSNLKLNMSTNNINFISSLCIICQKELKKGDSLVPATEKGVSTLTRSADCRKSKNDLVFSDAIIRIESNKLGFKYHANCYATFTSASIISRLTDRRLDQNDNLQLNTNGEDSDASNEFTSSVDWAKCILCQKSTKVDKDLRTVKTFSMETTIKSFGNVDGALNNRIASGSINLIDCACYHLKCLNKYRGLLRENAVSNTSKNTAFSKLISSLRSDGNEGKVF